MICRAAAKKRRSSGAVFIGIFFLAGSIAGCASMGDGRGRYEHPEWGYSVPYPNQVAASEGNAWRKVRVEDADLAFRGPNDAFMALSSHCDESEDDPAVLGSQLLVGLQNRTRVASERFEFAGGHVFSQIVEATQGDVAVRTKTITLVRGGCVVDWVLAALDSLPDLPDAIETFDSWWRGFDPGSMPGSVDGLAEAGR